MPLELEELLEELDELDDELLELEELELLELELLVELEELELLFEPLFELELSPPQPTNPILLATSANDKTRLPHPGNANAKSDASIRVCIEFYRNPMMG